MGVLECRFDLVVFDVGAAAMSLLTNAIHLLTTVIQLMIGSEITAT